MTRLTLLLVVAALLATAGGVLATRPTTAASEFVESSVTVTRAVTTHRNGHAVVRYVPVVHVVRLKARAETVLELQTVTTAGGVQVRRITHVRLVPTEHVVNRLVTAVLTRNGRTETVVRTTATRVPAVTVQQANTQTVEHTNTQTATQTSTETHTVTHTQISPTTVQLTTTATETETETRTEVTTLTATLPGETTTVTLTVTTTTTVHGGPG